MIIVMCCDYDNLGDFLNAYFTTEEITTAGVDTYLVQSYGEEVIFVNAGVTKADVARTAGAILNQYQNLDIDYLIGVGNIGFISQDPEVIGNVVITKCAFQYDVNFSSLGFPVTVLPGINKGMFQSDPELISESQNAVRETGLHYFVEATASADRFASGKKDIAFLKKYFEARTVDTEAAVIEEIGYVYEIPTVVLKGVSNFVNKNASNDYASYHQTANNNALNVAINLIYLLVS